MGNYAAVGQKIQVIGKGAFDQLGDNPKKVFRFLLAIFGIVMLFKFGKQILRFFGIDADSMALKDKLHQEELEIEENEHNEGAGSTINPFDVNTTSSKGYGKEGQVYEEPYSGTGCYWDEKAKKWYPTKETKGRLQALVDRIYQDTFGFTLMGYSEQAILRLGNLNLAKMKYVMYYWDTKYKAAENGFGIAKYLNSKNLLQKWTSVIQKFNKYGWYY